MVFTVAHKEATTSCLLSIPKFQTILTHAESRIVLLALEDESIYSDLSFITNEEALIFRDSITPSNPTIARIIMPIRFPESKLRLIYSENLKKFLKHRFWQYHRSVYNNFDRNVDKLFVIDSSHFQSPTVLCGPLSLTLNEILRRLLTEAETFLNMELYARNALVPGPAYTVTPSMKNNSSSWFADISLTLEPWSK